MQIGTPAPGVARGRLRAIAAGVANVLGLPTPVREQWVSLVDLIAGESVSYIDTAAGYTFDRTFSAINGTGVPVQFSVAIGEGTRVARVLGEAGRPGHSMHERLELGGRQAVALMELLNSRSALPAIDRVLALLLPPDTNVMREWTGALWCGVAMTAAGKGRVRFYLNQRWGDVETRVARLGDAIGLVAGSDSRVQWRSAARHLGDQLKPYGVALDVDATSVRRIKVYSAARSATVDAIASYVQTAVPNADLQPAELLVELCERAGGWNRPWMVMPCLEFDREADVARAKIDVALCALRSSDVALDGVMRDMLRAGSLPSDDYVGVMAAMSSRALNHVRPERLQYASVGCVPGRPELTVYFSPDLIDVDDRSLLASSACTTDALV